METTITGPETYHLRTAVALYLGVTRIVFNCLRSSIVTFLACKVTYKIVFFVQVTCKISWRQKFTMWRPKFFLLVSSWLPNKKVNFEPWMMMSKIKNTE